MRDAPLSAKDVKRYLAEVGDVLGSDGPRRALIMVGGSLLAWHGLRQATGDVDTVSRIDMELAHAARQVAARHELDGAWLNDAAAQFRPAGLRVSDCDVLASYPRLQVLGAPLRYVFVMKLRAARTTDHNDLLAMWNSCGFDSPQEATALFHEAYPRRRHDPLLGNYVAMIAASASRSAIAFGPDGRTLAEPLPADNPYSRQHPNRRARVRPRLSAEEYARRRLIQHPRSEPDRDIGH